MVDSTLELPSLLDTETGDLVLRVCGTNRHGQIVRLRSAKCTVGSGPHCTLRLRARGVGPIHCLILRGAGGSLVRRWSLDTRLNGRAFTNAVLAPGDRLSIGAVELEVLSSGKFERLEEEPRTEKQLVEQAEQLEVSEAAPVDLDEVLRRIGDAGLLRDEEKRDEPPAEPERELPPDPADEQPAPAPHKDEEEESIDDYMVQLMERVRATAGELEQAGNRPQVSQSCQVGEPASRAKGKADTRAFTPPASQTPTPQQQEPAEMSPRAVAPEKCAGLSAMRELANFSAHTAINRYTKRQLKLSKRTKLLIAIVASVVGVVLTGMWWRTWTGNPTLTFYSAIISFIVALFWGGQYLMLTFDMIRVKSHEFDREREKHHGEKHHGDTEDTENTKRVTL